MLIGILQTFAVARRLFAARSVARARRCRSRARRRSTSSASIKVATAAPIVPYLLLVLMLIVRPRRLARHARRMNDSGAARCCRAAVARRRAEAPGCASISASGSRAAVVLSRVLAASCRGFEHDFGRSLLTPDGHRRGVRAVVQRAARADRPAVVRPRRVFRPRRLRRDPLDARDQPRPADPDAARCRWPAPPAGCCSASCSDR